MKERGLEQSLIEIKKADVVGMVNCLRMLKEQGLAYIINRLSLSMVRAVSFNFQQVQKSSVVLVLFAGCDRLLFVSLSSDYDKKR